MNSCSAASATLNPIENLMLEVCLLENIVRTRFSAFLLHQFFFLIKLLNASAVSSTDYIVDTQLCKLRDMSRLYISHFYGISKFYNKPFARILYEGMYFLVKDVYNVWSYFIGLYCTAVVDENNLIIMCYQERVFYLYQAVECNNTKTLRYLRIRLLGGL